MSKTKFAPVVFVVISIILATIGSADCYQAKQYKMNDFISPPKSKNVFSPPVFDGEVTPIKKPIRLIYGPASFDSKTSVLLRFTESNKEGDKSAIENSVTFHKKTSVRNLDEFLLWNITVDNKVKWDVIINDRTKLSGEMHDFKEAPAEIRMLTSRTGRVKDISFHGSKPNAHTSVNFAELPMKPVKTGDVAMSFNVKLIYATLFEYMSAIEEFKSEFKVDNDYIDLRVMGYGKHGEIDVVVLTCDETTNFLIDGEPVFSVTVCGYYLVDIKSAHPLYSEVLHTGSARGEGGELATINFLTQIISKFNEK